ncbi:MAG: hypothetical protein UV61_C0001G0023 [Candidatus Gottesmanbacteria bacterium GW2011_GWB1_43_11]|uniref:Uncharacterized protein n=1 Tax=Candidatus Gottesmanbacteria bacterium GW2011_GWB1_43_11 TaxID=1618446 RepID=A0A0G1EXE7_9BACT|nr:MAG: hypothetical protein UV04_C0016G0022 [Candidatus Gottesmanbacteria bacterium GW2011_GWA2_42_16]KKS52455.1 MAG: hypothetical protein UV17_C0045G0015 [Candidatus Gottesmanbacteria bacterium GW2011_GWA1_42_26]KKS81539.1 MAG: hypothetical protein UV55_C0012G0023 [Candidatus Gottesmanbacteria bacterium GW2011_GWC1_43_10]KKS87616.1 MAG: hypothetical protein UV61_C0001G0023 [Candidatus Gottesmanbacteria bacterium GW2011_GWB1_43_11]OGG10080.1 MAG: hypothetical protein A2699_06070 [Candidatus Go
MNFRKLFYKISIGEIVEDYGVFAADNFYGLQELRLLKCRSKSEDFFVLEGSTKIRFLFGFDIRYFKISKEGLSNLNSLLNTKIFNK